MRRNVTGFIESLLIAEWGAGVGGDLIQIVIDIINQIYPIVMSSGIQILIFLAGLQTINPSIFEASSLEGATGWENFWKITFPMISPMILVVVVYTIVDFMVRTDSEVMNYVNITVNRLREFGFGSAMAMIYFLVIAAILGIVGLLISRLVYYYD
jgi:ABC-type sugar transport system permease subunit